MAGRKSSNLIEGPIILVRRERIILNYWLKLLSTFLEALLGKYCYFEESE